MTVKVSNIIKDQSFGLSIVPKPVGLRQPEKAVDKVAQKTLATMGDASPEPSPPPSPEKKEKTIYSPDSPERTKLAKVLEGLAFAALDGMTVRRVLPIEETDASSVDTRNNPSDRPKARVAAMVRNLEAEALKDALTELLPEVVGSKIALGPKEAPAPKAEIYKLFGKKGFDREFYGYAKGLSSNKRLGFMQFKRDIYGPFLELLRQVEVEQTLDWLVHKDAAIGVNKTPEEQARHVKIITTIDLLMRGLQERGLKGVQPGEDINFWSGREGAARASTDAAAFSDSDLPAFCFLFECWKKAKQSDQGNRLVGSLMPRLFSYIFSRYAQGVVNVYLASNAPKSGDDETKLLADSAFWGTELGNLVQNDAVTKVNLFIYNRSANTWNRPIDLKSTDPAVRKLRDALQITVRSGDFAISVGTLSKYCNKWRTSAAALGLIPGVKALDKASNV